MDPIIEVKSNVEQLGKAFEEFKAANEAQMKEIKSKGAADPVLEEKLQKLNDEMSGLQDRLEKAGKQTEEKLAEIETLAARPGATAQTGRKEDEEHKKAFLSFMRKGVDTNLAGIQKKAMSVGSDTDGGYLVPHEVSNRIITRMFDTTPMRQLATIMTITSEAVEMLRDTDEASAAWVGETGARAQTNTAQIGKVRIPVHEMYANPQVTQKLLDDAEVDVAAWLATKVADKMGRSENNAFVNGDGVAKPRGFLSYTTAATGDATRAWGTIEHVATGSSGAFPGSNPADVLHNLMMAMKPFYQQGASWMMPRAVLNLVRKIKDTTGNYIWQPSLQAAQPSQLLGAPVVMSEDMPALAANSLSLAFANFKEAYTIVDRAGFTTLRDPFSNKPFVSFYTTKRVGGDVTNFEAIKLLKFA